MTTIVSRNIKQNNPDYPSAFLVRLGSKAPKQMAVLGDISILRNKPIGILCSEKSILDQMIIVDGMIRKWCGEDQTLISGFHSKPEKINATIILDYQRPAVLCLGSSFSKKHLNKKVKKALEAGRLLLLCPFESDTQIRKERDLLRNLIVAALSESILVAHREGDDVFENFLAETRAWDIPTTVLEMKKEVRNVDIDVKEPGYSVVKRVLPLFSKVEKFGQIIGKNGLGEVRPPRE